MKHRLRDRNLKLVDKKDILQQDPYKLSIHSSAVLNKSDSASKRLNLSRMLENSRKKISMRKASQLFNSGVRPQSSKVAKRNEVIEFDNIKWISIISAYDPTRLKNVSVSKKTCQKFLETQGQNIKTDSRSLLYFNDLIKNFKSWLNKIHVQYFYIMETFLYGKRSVNVTLAALKPKIDEVINETTHMQQNLQNCLNSYENHEFRQLLKKYHAYLENSKQIEDIIIIVNKSKTKIVDLYKKFDDDKKIQQKLNRVKTDGIHEIKKIICQHNEIQIENQIMDRIQLAINEMAQKSGQAYRKIRGIKQLISRFKNTEHQSGQVMQKLDMESINLMGKVCRQICIEAEAFDFFSSKFLLQGDIINDDLKNIIRKYEQDMTIERKRAIELQMKFLNIILSETIKKLKENSKISIVYQNAQTHHQEYRKVLRMIQDIADCLIDQNKKISLEKLIKETKTVFDRLYDELKYIKENKKFEEIDTQQGLISILEVSKLIKEYKDKILLVRKKFQTTHRDIIMTPIKIQQITQDKQTDFINCVISLSKKINNSNLKDRIQDISCFSPLLQQIGLVKMAQQIKEENILEDITAISNQFLKLQEQNILQQFFGPLKLQNLIFKESIVMLEIKKLSSKTKQKNLIPQLTELTQKRNEWVEKHKKISPQMKRYFQRILADTLVKGLKQEDIKQIQNPRSITFPTKQQQIQPLRSKGKYRQVLFDLIQNSVLQTSKSIKSEASEKDNHQKSKDTKKSKNKHNFYVSDILQQNITNINNFINSFTKITQIKKNLNSEHFLAKEYLIQFSQKLFSMVCIKQSIKENNQAQEKQKISSWIQSLINICSDRILFLTRESLEEENTWRTAEKKRNLDNSFDLNKLPLHVEKVIELLNFYKNKTAHLSELCTKALETFDQPIENMQNPKQIVQEFSKLNLYGKVLISVVKYLKDTQQTVHVILDNAKCPIALINPTKNSLKQIFPGIKKGKELRLAQIQKLTLTAPKIGIELKAKKSKAQDPKQTSNKGKKVLQKQSQIMDEDFIEVQQSLMKEQMADQIPDEDVEEIDDFQEQMPEDQMGEEVNEEPEQQMIQDFEAPEDDINDDIEEKKLEQMMQESSKLGKSKNKNKSINEIDDFEEYDWQDNEKKSKNINKQLQQQQKAKQKAKEEEQLKKREQQTKQKQQEEKMAKQKEQQQRQKRMKKQHIVFSQTQPPKKILQHSVYEVLNFVTSLYQLKTLISYLHSFEESYMKNSIQWSKIQQYFNSHNDSSSNETKQSLEKAKKDVEKYIKSIDQEVDNKLKKDFQSEPNVFNEIKVLETVKQLKKDLLLLKNANWQTLQKMLLLNHVSYNILKNKNSVLYISIKDPSLEYDEYGSINGYLLKNFKYYKRAQFDIKEFAEKCFNLHQTGTKNDSYRINSYVAKSERSLITNPTETQKTYQKLKITLQNFSSGAKDHVNKFDLCLDLYKKALQIKQKVELDLNWYSDQIKFLQKSGTDQSDILSYITFVKDNIKNVIKKVKSLESKLYNLSFKCEKNTIFECFEEMSELYGDQIETKMTLTKGEHKFTTLVFDKTNYKQNLSKIRKILSTQPTSRQSHAQKLILSLLLGSGAQILKEIEQSKILQNANILVTKQYELLLETVCTLRVNHSYVFIKEEGLQFFTIRKDKQECILSFIKKVAGSVLENKSISNLITSNECLASLQVLLTSTDHSFYQSIFFQSKIQTLFKENVKENSHLKQVQVVISEEYFNLGNKNWKEDGQKIIKSVIECVQNQKKQVSKVLSNIKKLKPCKLIFEKHLSSQKSIQISSLWQEHLQSFKKIQSTTNQLIQKNHWLLAVNSILTQLKDKVIQPINQNLQVITSLLSTSAKTHSLQQIQAQVTNVFEWMKGLIQPESKHKFLVVTLSSQQSILYFDSNIDSLSLEYFSENFNFLQPNNTQLKQFLFNLLFANLTSEKAEQIKKIHKLQKNDILYQIDSQKLSTSVLTKISQISSPNHHQNRHETIREFVRVFNKIYFISKTSKEINFKQQSQMLIKLQNQIKKELKQLQVIYHFKNFVTSNGPILWKVNSELQKLNKVFEDEFSKNEKIPDDEIQDVLTKLQKIKVNKNSNSIDLYDPFFAWVYHTVMSLLKLPFYNIITHTVLNSQYKTQTQFLAVVVTEKSTDPGQNNEELQKCLKEMFSFTQHKPIYLKENDLTVELTKEPAFVQFSLTIKDLQLKQIVDFLNQNYKEDNNKDQVQIRKEFYFRVDELREKINSKGKSEEEQIFLKLIPIKDFLKSSSQQFNLQINQQKLCSSIECNIVYAPSQITDKINLQEFLPLNGSSVDTFDDVYMGKHFKVQKLKEWLYNFYKTHKNQAESKNRQIESENFFQQFIIYHKINVLPEYKQVLEKVLKNINYESISKTKNPSKQNILFLSSSLLLKKECTNNLNSFKLKQYQAKPQIYKLYDTDIKHLIKRIQSQVHDQLYVFEGQIKVNMENKIKKLAAEKVKQIEKKYEAQKEKKNLASKETVDVPQSQQKINLPEGQNPAQTPSLADPIEPILAKIDEKQQDKEILEKLRKKKFDSYVQKRIELEFKTFDKNSSKQLMTEILDHFGQKISKYQHIKPTELNGLLIKKVDKTYEGKGENQKDKVIFMYLMLENNDISYAELYITESDKY